MSRRVYRPTILPKGASTRRPLLVQVAGAIAVLVGFGLIVFGTESADQLRSIENWMLACMIGGIIVLGLGVILVGNPDAE